MSENLKKCMQELQEVMAYKHKPTREIILKFLANKKCVYNALREISINIINKNIPLKKSQLKRLNPYTKTIKSLKCGVKRKSKRRQLVLQSGGFLPWLLPLVASAIPAVIDLIRK